MDQKRLENIFEEEQKPQIKSLIKNIEDLKNSLENQEQNITWINERLENIGQKIKELTKNNYIINSCILADLISNDKTPTSAKTAVFGLLGSYAIFPAGIILSLKQSKEKDIIDIYKSLLEIIKRSLSNIILTIEDRSKAMKNLYYEFEYIVDNLSLLRKRNNSIVDSLKNNSHNDDIQEIIKYSKSLFISAEEAFDIYTNKQTAFVKKFAEKIKDSLGDFNKLFSDLAVEIAPSKLKRAKI